MWSLLLLGVLRLSHTACRAELIGSVIARERDGSEVALEQWRTPGRERSPWGRDRAVGGIGGGLRSETKAHQPLAGMSARRTVEAAGRRGGLREVRRHIRRPHVPTAEGVRQREGYLVQQLWCGA